MRAVRSIGPIQSSFGQQVLVQAFAFTWLITLSLWPFGWFVVSVFACIDAAVYKGRPAA